MSTNARGFEKSYQKKTAKTSAERNGSLGPMYSKRSEGNYVEAAMWPISNFAREN